MTGFAVYSATEEPDCLYATGDIEAIDGPTTAEMVWAGDRPLDMVVDLETRRLWWTFEADRTTKSTRTGYFIAAYDGGDDLFKGVADELRALHETDKWSLPYTGDIRRDAGFELWRLPESVDGTDTAAFDSLVDHLRTDDGRRQGAPVTVGMAGYRSALQVVHALSSTDLDVTVGVDGGDDTFLFQHIDLLLNPDGEVNFEFRTEGVATAEDGATDQDASDDATTTVERDAVPRSADVSAGGLLSRIAAVVLVGLLGFATYSFFTRQPVQPISGLATFGSLFGTVGAVGLWYATSGGTTRESGAVRGRSAPGNWLWAPFRAYGDRAVVVVTLGTFCGFVFPTIFWEAGLRAGRDGFLFGSLSTLAGSAPAVAVYVAGLFGGAVVLGIAGSYTDRWEPLGGTDLLRLSGGFGIYGLCLLGATALGDALWYGFVPAI